VIVPLDKKNDRLCCDNYRGISLLPHCEKVIAKVMLQRIQRRTEDILSEAQAGFRAKRSTIDQLLTLRRLAETYVEFGKYLYVCYVDFQKAFDCVWRIGLWSVMRFLGYDEKLVRLLESLYNGTMSAVRVGGGLTEWFATIIGVMQGCILSPFLFNILLEVVMALALNCWEFGIKVSGTCLSNLRFADDISLLVNSEGELQQLVNRVQCTLPAAGLGWLSVIPRLKHNAVDMIVRY